MGKGNRLLAASYDLLTGSFERNRGAAWRAQVLAGASGRVLDVGCGTGANFPIYQALAAGGSPLEIWATEPDPHMRKRAVVRAERLGLPVRLTDAPAEALPYPDGHFDLVAITLVLCTVDQPARSLAEAARVLRPGGELRFLEHVRADGSLGRWQDRLTPLWRAVAGGCHLNRQTGAAIEDAFDDVRYMAIDTPFPVGRILLGQARRRA